jgi:hypothetical protein
MKMILCERPSVGCSVAPLTPNLLCPDERLFVYIFDPQQERVEVTGTKKSYLNGLSGVIFVHRQNDTVLCGNAELGTVTWTPRAECR